MMPPRRGKHETDRSRVLYIWVANGLTFGMDCGTLRGLRIRRDGRVVEGTPLLRERRVYSLTEGSNPSLSAKKVLMLQKFHQ